MRNDLSKLFIYDKETSVCPTITLIIDSNVLITQENQTKVKNEFFFDPRFANLIGKTVGYSFTLTYENHSYLFCLKTEIEMNEWVDTLTSCGAMLGNIFYFIYFIFILFFIF